jgi:hypothetical protein
MDVVSIFHNLIYIYIYTLYNNMLPISMCIYCHIYIYTHRLPISMEFTNQKKTNAPRRLLLQSQDL